MASGPRQPKVVVMGPASDGQFRWSLLAGNGRIIADGAEGYPRKAGALRAIDAWFDITGADRKRIPIVDQTIDRRRRESRSTG